MQGTRFWSLVRELRSHMQLRATKAEHLKHSPHATTGVRAPQREILHDANKILHALAKTQHIQTHKYFFLNSNSSIFPAPQEWKNSFWKPLH